MNKKLLKEYQETLDLFDDGEQTIQYHDIKYNKVGMGRFIDIYGANEVKWGNRIIIPTEGRFKGYYTNNKYCKLFTVVKTRGDEICFGIDGKKIIGCISFWRCKLKIGEETRV